MPAPLRRHRSTEIGVKRKRRERPVRIVSLFSYLSRRRGVHHLLRSRRVLERSLSRATSEKEHDKDQDLFISVEGRGDGKQCDPARSLIA